MHAAERAQRCSVSVSTAFCLRLVPHLRPRCYSSRRRSCVRSGASARGISRTPGERCAGTPAAVRAPRIAQAAAPRENAGSRSHSLKTCAPACGVISPPTVFTSTSMVAGWSLARAWRRCIAVRAADLVPRPRNARFSLTRVQSRNVARENGDANTSTVNFSLFSSDTESGNGCRITTNGQLCAEPCLRSAHA